MPESRPRRRSVADRCRTLRDQWYPKSVRPYQIYTAAVLAECDASTVLLDLGCGREARWLRSVAPRVGTAIGMDYEIAAGWNEPRRGLFCGDAHQVPLAGGSVDVLSTMNTIEHFADPRRVFNEMFRVLRPGGHLFIVTVNLRFPPVALARFLPHCLRRRINAAATDSRPEDTFPVFYRANTTDKLQRIGTEAGFRVERLDLLSHHPEYFMFSTLAYRCWAAFERWVLRRPAFAAWRHFIFAHFVKPEEGVVR